MKRRGGKGQNKKPDPVFAADSAVESELGFAEYQNFCILPKELPDGAYYFSSYMFLPQNHKKIRKGGREERKKLKQ